MLIEQVMCKCPEVVCEITGEYGGKVKHLAFLRADQIYYLADILSNPNQLSFCRGVKCLNAQRNVFHPNRYLATEGLQWIENARLHGYIAVHGS